MFKFWFTVLQLQLLTLLVFVRSLRTGNFQLYVQSLRRLSPGSSLFTTTTMHNGYQFTTVDIVILPHLHPGINAEFKKGHFTVKKTDHSF